MRSTYSPSIRPALNAGASVRIEARMRAIQARGMPSASRS
jgi:hypothetical protein